MKTHFKKWKHKIDLCVAFSGFPPLMVLSTLIFHDLPCLENFLESSMVARLFQQRPIIYL